MSLTVTFVVLLAALLHASWNFLVKKADDKMLSMSAVVIGHLPFGFAALLLVPLPSWEAWPYILASAVLHTSVVSVEFIPDWRPESGLSFGAGRGSDAGDAGFYWLAGCGAE